MSKLCSKCKTTKDELLFGKRTKSKDGLDSWCKDCIKEKSNRYYHSNKEKCLKAIKKDYQNNREHKIAYAKQYYIDNWDYHQGMVRQWQLKNPEKVTDIKRRYNLKRRALKRETAVETISPMRVFDRDQWVCGICKEDIDKGLVWPDRMSVSVDHVTPLSKGGTHTYDNLQASHYICNVRKSAKVGG